ncbi:MAG: amino acid permease [Acidimicrobiales bacterium]
MTVTADPTASETSSAPTDRLAPKATGHLVELPEPVGYRLKKKLLGPPLHSERIVHERLGKPTALAVFASDCLSSSAYATEEILRVLIPVIGALAFGMIMPITTAILIVLLLLILSYRQTIKEYPSAGGAYIVTRDNFGLLPAQVAGVALLTDYILTVAVSVAAGSAAIGSLVPSLAPYTLELAIAFVVIIAAVNLKGVKESGLAFSVPTYFFVLMMALLAIVGVAKVVSGNLPTAEVGEGALTFGTEGMSGALFAGAGLYIVLKAFASGGAAVTGVEAISNGVPAFKEPAWRNARSTLVIMGFLAGGMFVTVSLLAWKIQPVPYVEGTPTVISQVGKAVFGDEGIGHVLFALFQIGTTLILVLAANTSFADFPRLASFHAGDNFMPRQLTKRGHRLVFSNGIISLAVAAVVLLLVTDAQVDRLIPLYAIGVFLSFTLSQAGMSRHHVKKKEPGWRRGLVVNAAGAVVSGVVCVVIAMTKFTQGAWFIILLVPFLVWLLVRLNRQYETEEEVLIRDAPKAATQPILRRHVVVVLVDKMDMASARALQYARTLTPDELVAVHFDLDPIRTEDLTDAWTRTGYSRIPLDVVACPDRRIERAAAEVVARQLVDGDTEVSVLIPKREYSRFWHRLVHDRTAEELSRTLSTLPHCNVTVVPFHIASPSEVPKLVVPTATGAGPGDGHGHLGRGRKAAKAKAGPTIDLGDFELPADRTPIAQVGFRQRARVVGKVYSVRVQPWSGTPALELTLIDDSGALQVVFLGRRQLAGVKVGTRLMVEGLVGEHKGRMAMLNPVYELLTDPHALAEAPPAH